MRHDEKKIFLRTKQLLKRIQEKRGLETEISSPRINEISVDWLMSSRCEDFRFPMWLKALVSWCWSVNIVKLRPSRRGRMC